jgi:hypothetical protein
VSKERARRRTEREAAQAAQRRAREVKAQRAASRAAAANVLTTPIARLRQLVTRWHRRTYPSGDPFARRRRRQSMVVVALLLAVQVITWWLTPSWGLRIGGLGISVLVAPVLRLLLFDRG